jgi:transcriptional regulator with XRE-family HTH domain
MENNINERLFNLRKSLDLNQAEFAKRLGLTHASISRIESGKTVITEQNINLICLTFGVSEDWLRNGTGEMFDKEVSGVALKRLVDCFSQLQPETREMIFVYAEMLLKNEKAMKGQSTDTVKQSAGSDPAAEKGRGTEG